MGKKEIRGSRKCGLKKKKKKRKKRKCGFMGRAQQRHQTDARGIQEGKAENGGANGEKRKEKPCGEKIENKLESKHQTISPHTVPNIQVNSQLGKTE